MGRSDTRRLAPEGANVQKRQIYAEITLAPARAMPSSVTTNFSPAALRNSSASLGPPVCRAKTVGPAPEIKAATPALRSFVSKAKDCGGMKQIWAMLKCMH